jgi:hypothetical protein
MTLNIVGRKVTPYEFAKRYTNNIFFKQGYDSVMAGSAYDYNITDKLNEIAYARGRMFAIWCKQNNAPRAVWRNGVAAKTLVERVAFAAARRNTFV